MKKDTYRKVYREISETALDGTLNCIGSAQQLVLFPVSFSSLFLF